MIVDGYVRVSQVGARAGETFISPVVQREQIERWASLQGVLIGRIFEELDESGGRKDRPLLQEGIARVERGESHGVVVAYLSRFGRSLLDALQAIERITDAGGTFVSVQEGIDFSTDAGRLVLRVLFSVAEWERDRTRAEWNVARERAVARGAWMGPVPFGYRYRPPGPLKVDPVEGPLVAEVFRRRADGASIDELRRFLDGAGAKTPRGCEWRSSGVIKLLRYRVYRGEVRHGEFRNLAAHAPLVDELTWQRAQRHNLRVPTGHGDPPALLRGILRCSGCRRPLRSAFAYMPSSYGSRWYMCTDIESTAPCPAPVAVADSLAEPYLEELFWQELGSGRRSRGEKRIDALERDVAQRERELTAYRDNPALPVTLGADRFAQGIAVRVRRFERKQLELVRARIDLRPPNLPSAAGLRGRWPSMSIRERRAAMAEVFDCAFVSRGTNVEERLFVCRRGDAPPDLPQFNPQHRFESRPFNPTACSRRVTLRRPDHAWSDDRLHSELAVFLAGHERWPSFVEFQEAGLALLYRQVQHHGGPRCVARVFGLPLEAPLPRRGHGWSEGRVRRELREYLNGKTQWPSVREFRRDGRGVLRIAATWFGGPEYWADQLQVELGKRRRTQIPWSYMRMKHELREFTQGRRDWPPVDDFKAAGRLPLYHAIRRRGVREQLAADLNLRLAPGRTRVCSPSRWNDAAIEATLDQFLNGRTSWPSYTEFEKAGLHGLYIVLLKPGVREEWAQRYGMRAPMRPGRGRGRRVASARPGSGG